MKQKEDDIQENNTEFNLLIDHQYSDSNYNSFGNTSNSNNNHNNHSELKVDYIECDNDNNHNHNSFSKYRSDYWRSRINIGLFAIIFLQFLFYFGYIPYTIYYIQLLIKSFSVYNLVILVIFHFIFITTQVSLFKTTFTDPGTIPKGFPDSERYKDYNINFNELSSTGEKRRCVKCDAFKPDRTHHCSKCKRCILKMDHHCPFVNNCVGFYNYKYFVLFLTWTSVLCIYIMGTTLENFKLLVDPHHARGAQPSILMGVVFIVALVFGIGMTFFTSTHYRYILHNETTIEHFEKNSPRSTHSSRNYSHKSSSSQLIIPINIYNINYTFNFKQVFGNSPWKWFLPIQNEITPMSSGLNFYTTKQQSENKLFY